MTKLTVFKKRILNVIQSQNALYSPSISYIKAMRK